MTEADGCDENEEANGDDAEKLYNRSSSQLPKALLKFVRCCGCRSMKGGCCCGTKPLLPTIDDGTATGYGIGTATATGIRMIVGCC